MAKFSLVIDLAKCHDCNNCMMACKDEFVDNDWAPFSAAQPGHGQRWMNIMRKEGGQYPNVEVAYMPRPCQHCEDAPCVKNSKDGAVYQRDDGIVIIDPQKAKGQKEIVELCPYGSIFWNEEIENKLACLTAECRRHGPARWDVEQVLRCNQITMRRDPAEL